MEIQFYQKILEKNLPPGAIREILQQRDFFYSPDLSVPGLREHSQLIDDVLGLRALELEKSFHKKASVLNPEGNALSWGPELQGRQTRLGLHPQTLQTTYHECGLICEWLDRRGNEHRMVDLGAGYGRLGIVMDSLLPGSTFVGVECFGPRYREGVRIYEKFGFMNAGLIEANLLSEDFAIPRGSVYFVFDFGTPQEIAQIVDDLLRENSSFIIVARGHAVLRILEETHGLSAAETSELTEPMKLFEIGANRA